MTDRINAITVVLKKDVRDDDVVDIINAVLMVKGVLSVQRHVASLEDYIAYSRARAELREKLFTVLENEGLCDP